MAVKTTPLTDTQIKALKATSKDKKYFDGGGLFLLVKSTGVKLWRFKYKKQYHIKRHYYLSVNTQKHHYSKCENNEMKHAN
jgi:hypothetical protein